MRKIGKLIGMLMLLATIVISGCTRIEETHKESNEVKNAAIKKLTAETICSIEKESIMTAEGGIYYKDNNGKYGIMTFDGKMDTGAKYDYCAPSGIYFQVVTTKPADTASLEGMNCVGLVDVKGKQIVPEKYAVVKVLNERYVKVSEVTEETDEEEEALVYATDRMFSVGPSDGDSLYKGIWSVYDILTGEKVKGVTGTNSYVVTARGNYIEYVTDDKEKLVVNGAGKTLPPNATLLDNGYYIINEKNQGTAYDSDGVKLFTYDANGYIPKYSVGDYILASQSDDDVYRYAFMDKTGAIVSGVFSEYPTLYGELVQAENKIFSFAGDEVIEGTYQSVAYDTDFGKAWVLKNNKKYTVIQSDGKILCQGTEDDEISIGTGTYIGCISKKAEEVNMYYSYADEDFTIKGISFAPWLVKTYGANGTENIVDVITGQNLIEGYIDYSYVSAGSASAYIYAKGSNGVFDVFKIK